MTSRINTKLPTLPSLGYSHQETRLVDSRPVTPCKLPTIQWYADCRAAIQVCSYGIRWMRQRLLNELWMGAQCTQWNAISI